MNTEEDNNWKGKMNTPTPEVELVVEMNSYILKTIHSRQAELWSLIEDSLNERKEQQAINEALLRNMMGGCLHGKPTHYTNKSKREPYHERASSPREVEKEGTPEATKGDHHSPTSDDSLSPRRKKAKKWWQYLGGSFEK